MQTLTVRKIGNSYGVILPKEILAHLQASEGTEIPVVVTERGGLQLRRPDATFQRQMVIAEELMDRYRNTLRKLAE